MNQPDGSAGNDGGLAGAGPGKYKRRTASVLNRLQLRRIVPHQPSFRIAA